ncbi:MAG: xylulokinase [Opitutales bacterium]
MSYYIGIDVGSSSTKAVVVDGDGKVVYTTLPAYAFATPKPGWAESNPEDWWQAAVKALRAVTSKYPADQIAGIGLTGQMHGLVLLDKAGKVLRPALMWNDQRTAEECAELTAKVGADKVLEVTGNPILTGFTAPKIAWVQKHEPEVWDQVEKILLPKDYIRFCLSGGFFSEVSDASGTSLLDVGQRDWSPLMLEACGVKRSMLPELTESTAASTQVNAEAAAATGLNEGTPIIAGGGDQAAGAVGCGIVKPGVVSATLGTSGVVFAHSETYQPEPQGRLHAFCAAVPGKWHYMGVQLSCAGSFQWFHDKLGASRSFKEIDALAATAPAGSEGLLFLPYLSGERTPHPDPDARGAFIGLSLRHSEAHLARSVLEGVAFGLRDGLELIRGLGVEPSEIVISGGGAKSVLWTQILADIFKTPMVRVTSTDGAAYGAALLAAVGTGAFDSVETACEAWVKEVDRVEVGNDTAAYDAYYGEFAQLYPALQTRFASLARTVEAHS